MHYKDKTTPFSQEAFEDQVPLTPKAYRKRYEKDLNEVRTRAGLAVKPIYERDSDMKSLQLSAGII